MTKNKCNQKQVGQPSEAELSSRSHPRHLMGKRTAPKDTIIDITSDSQVNSNFPYKSHIQPLKSQGKEVHTRSIT